MCRHMCRCLAPLVLATCLCIAWLGAAGSSFTHADCSVEGVCPLCLCLSMVCTQSQAKQHTTACTPLIRGLHEGQHDCRWMFRVAAGVHSDQCKQRCGKPPTSTRSASSSSLGQLGHARPSTSCVYGKSMPWRDMGKAWISNPCTSCACAAACLIGA